MPIFMLPLSLRYAINSFRHWCLAEGHYCWWYCWCHWHYADAISFCLAAITLRHMMMLLRLFHYFELADTPMIIMLLPLLRRLPSHWYYLIFIFSINSHYAAENIDCHHYHADAIYSPDHHLRPIITWLWLAFRISICLYLRHILYLLIRCHYLLCSLFHWWILRQFDYALHFRHYFLIYHLLGWYADAAAMPLYNITLIRKAIFSLHIFIVY